MTGPILFVISWMLFGVYEIGYSSEDPFQRTLRLSILCDDIRRDALGMNSFGIQHLLWKKRQRSCYAPEFKKLNRMK